MIPVRRLAALSAITVLVVACGSGATPTPVPQGTPAASTAESTTPSAAPSPVAVVPDGQLVVATRLTVCSDIPYPPMEFFDASGNPTGSDIDIATEIANRLGLKVSVQNTVFDTIIAALQGGKCDIIISDQNITTDRVKQVDMIPYFKAGQAFVVAKGNPAAINTTLDLCGKKIAAETGTTEVDYLDGTGDYKGNGLTQACTAAGKPAIVTTPFQKDSDAALALQASQVDAYFADFPVAANYANAHPDAFELAPIAQLNPILAGISVQNDSGHKALEKAVQTALISMINDGTYVKILKGYQDDQGAVTADIASQLNLTKLP